MKMREIMRIVEAELPSIKAYHGSPFNFDAFDISKIGTGEGAQAYGRGLYFADKPEVAQTYHDVKGTPGYMYEVQLNVEPSQLLDLDKSMAEQSPEVRKAFSNLLPQSAMTPEQTIRAFLSTEYAQSFQSASDVRGAKFALESNDPEEMADWLSRQKPGSSLYNLLTNDTGGTAYERLRAHTGSAIAASAALHKAGVRGIQYLDQGSRSAGDGTHNYVIFDPKLIKMLRKYPVTSA